MGALVVLKMFQQLFWGEVHDSQAFTLRPEGVDRHLIFSKRFVLAASVSVFLSICMGVMPSPWFEGTLTQMNILSHKLQFFSGN